MHDTSPHQTSAKTSPRKAPGEIADPVDGRQGARVRRPAGGPAGGPGSGRSWEKARSSVADRMKRTWRAFSADFAANALTYLGVLLAILVIFVFFAFGYFGDLVTVKNLRPVFFVATPALFFGLAHYLGRRSDLPATATAVGLIGGLTIPVMMSALFRDGSMWPPDVNGPARWPAYAVVGVVTATVYHRLARRERIYAYLAAPMIWAAAGALGLFWEHGMSAPQLFTVLGAIAISMALASRMRTVPALAPLAAPTVRMASVAAPAVLVLSLVFAFNDARVAGLADPGLTDLAPAIIVASLLTAAVLWVASDTGFAWAGLPVRLRRDISPVLRTLSYVSVGISLGLTPTIGLDPSWLGLGLVAYGIGIWALDRVVGGRSVLVVHVARIAGFIGLGLATIDPVTAVIGWGFVSGLTVARGISSSVRTVTAELAPVGFGRVHQAVELWIPPLVAIGAGVIRLVPTAAIPQTLGGLSIACAVGRFASGRFDPLRSYALGPAAILGFAAAAMAVVPGPDGFVTSLGVRGTVILMTAVTAALLDVAAPVRIPLAATALVAGTAMTGRAVSGWGTYGTAMADVVAFGVVGAVLVAVSIAGIGRTAVLAAGVVGHVFVYAALIVHPRIEDGVLVALGVIVATHAVEAHRVSRGGAPLVELLVEALGPAIRLAPAVIAVAAAHPLVILAADRFDVFPDPGWRLTASLVTLSWVNLWMCGRSRGVMCRLALVAAHAAALGAVLVAAPFRGPAGVAFGSAALLTAVVATTTKRPFLTSLSWPLATVAAALGAVEVGLAVRDVHFLVFGIAAVVVATSAVLNRRRGGDPGLTSPWLRAAVGVMLGVLPAIVGYGFADGRVVWLLAVVAAGCFAVLGWGTATGGVSLPVSVLVGFAYGDVAGRWVNLLEDPVWWMPLAFALSLGSVLLPGRYGWDLVHRPAAGTLAAGLGTAGVAIVSALFAGTASTVLLAGAVLAAALYWARREAGFAYASVVLFAAAGVSAGGGWLPITLAVAAAAAASLAEARRDTALWSPLAWTAAAFAVAAGWSGVEWLWPAPGSRIIAAGAASGVIAVIAAVSGHRAVPRRLARWALQAHAVGQVGLTVAVVTGAVEFDSDAVFRLAAAVLGVEAVVTAVVATIGRAARLAWVSAALATAALSFADAALGADAGTRFALSAALGAALVAVFGGLTSLGGRSQVAALWRWQPLAVAQVAIGYAVFSAFVAPAIDGELVLGIALGVEALAIGVLGTALVEATVVSTSIVFAAASVVALMAAFDLTVAARANTLVGAAIVAAGSSLAVHSRSSVRARVWLVPLRSAAGVAGVGAIALGYNSHEDAGAFALSATVAAVAAAYAAALAPSSAFVRGLRNTAAALVGVSAAYLTAAAITADVLVAPAVIGVAIMGLVAVGGGVPWSGRSLGALSGAGFALGVVSLVAAAAAFGFLSFEVGISLAVAGGSVAAFGAGTRRVTLIQGALVTWLAAALLIAGEVNSLGLHGTVIPIGIVVLAVIELERSAGRARGRWAKLLRALEWLVMAVPPTLAMWSMFTGLGYGVLVAAEGFALLAWGAATAVRRRAILGLALVTTAIVLSVAIPVVEGARRGLAGGTWLIVGAVGAAVLLAAGSALERSRARVGGRLSRLGEILEEWE